ncbi:MAG TPA: hypothetical protein VG167_01455, partial [Verrucomicrobiae bacterium]|nr:hypothetical protein [Verrucomicrobiae bacterium]
MTSTGNSIRALLTYAIILPLALMVGYMLATPLDFVSFSAVGLVLMALSVPLFMKWHHPMMFLSWNTTAVVFFLPGQPHLWLVVAMMGVLFALLQRAVVRDLPMIHTPSVILPLAFLAVVVFMTA